MGTRRSDAEARANVAAWCPDFQPAVPYPGALTPWDGRCRACGRLVRPTYANMSQGGGACRSCSRARGAAAQMLTDAAARERTLGHSRWLLVSSGVSSSCIAVESRGLASVGERAIRLRESPGGQHWRLMPFT